MGSNLRDIYNAIKANGDFKVDRSFEDFASKMNYKGYQNQIYNLLKTNGAKLSGGPDTFRRKLGLQRIDAHPEWTEKQRQKRLKDMQGDGSGAMLMRDNPAKQKPIENLSAFVHALDAGRVTAENNPTGTNVMSHDEKQRQLSGVVGKARAVGLTEDPLLDPSKPGISMTYGQLNEKGAKSASGLLDTSKAFDAFAKNEIDAEFKRAREAYAKEYNKYADYKYSDDLTQALGTSMANKKMANSEMAKGITKSVEANLSKYISDELTADKIHAAAKKMGVPDDYYAKNFLLPEMQNRVLDKFRQADLERYMPRGHVEYILRGIEDSMVGKIANSLKYTKEQRQMLEEANSITQQGGSRFVKPKMMDNVVRGAVSYATDSPLYAAAGMGASAGIAKATGWNGVKLASRMANTNLLGKIGYGAAYGTAHGFLTGASFGALNGAVQNYSTSDDTSVGAYLKAMGSSALSSGVNFAGMEGVGGAFAPLGYKIGINGLEKTSGQVIKHGAQKVGFEVAKTAMEGVGMATGGVLESIVAGHPQGFTVEGTLESCVTAALFKLSHVKDAGKGPIKSKSEVTKEDGFLSKTKKGIKGEAKDYAANFKNNLINFFASDKAKNAHLVFSENERKQIRDVFEAYGVGKEGSLSTLSNKASKAKYDGEGAATVYEAVMNSKDIPWDVRNKFSAYVAGSFSYARPIMDYHTFYSDGEPGKKVKYVCEYSKDGELLSETPYKTNEERDRIVYEKQVNAEYAKLHNTVGACIGKLFNDPELKKEFLVKQKGFDPSKPLDDPKNKAVVDELTKKDSDLQKEYFKFLLNHDRLNTIFEEVGDMFGLSLDEMNKAYGKESMLECTERETNALVELRRRLKAEIFPEDKVHAEQSAEDGKDIAANNNLGTEEPNNEAVVAVANELSQTEKEWQAAMDSNAELGGMYNNLKSQGLRNDQIYEAMLQNGATEEDLAPLAKYINANAKMQGMVDGTAKNIEANVQARVEDFSYKGTLNGEKQDGENMVYVTDADGRQLLVTSGDVAFDENGNPKEGVGDMLICRDEQTGEIVRVSASDVKFAGTKTAEDYGNEFRLHLQEKNSEAYAIAQQRQNGEGEGGQPPKGPKEPKGNGEGNGGGNPPLIPEGNQPPKEPKGPQGQEGEGGGTPLPEGGGTPPPSAPQEEGPKFADDTPVPMTKDSKGRPTADYMRMTPEQGAEYMIDTFGDSAENVIDGKIKKAEKAVKDAAKMKVDYTLDDADILAQEEEKKAAMEQAQKELDLYSDIKKAIAKQRLIDEAGRILGGGGTDMTGRYEKERKQGYRIGEGGVRYDRQKAEDQTGVVGKEATVLFTPNVSVKGRMKIVEADSVQASHTNGQVNPYHFGPDWQPKDRTSDASKNGAAKIAKEMDPEQITGDGNAFIGSAPSVNERHEVIQGNNRTEALKIMYEQHPDKAAEYKQWLIDHAKEFGLDAEAIAKMEKPMMVNELPVDDAKAKELGQYTAKDFETGGSDIPAESIVINKLGDRIENFANILLAQGSLGDDAKLSDIIMANSDRVLQYLQQQGVISETQAETLLADRTALRQWLNDVLRAGLFEGDKQTEAAFNKLPENAKKAVLATYLRDTKSGESARIKANLQHSFEAYYELMNIPEFANAKNLAEARAAVAAEIEDGNQSMFGEKPLREKYSSFELELAALYKGLKDQKTLTRLFNDYFDAVQGGKKNNKQQDAFKENVVDPISKEEAIKKIFESYDTIPAETQRQVDEAVKAVATEITRKTGREVVTDEKAAEERIREAENDEFNRNPLKFQIKTPEQRKAAENAYNLAAEHRPDKWKRYAIVDMDHPHNIPDYFEKKSLGDFWRRYYNKLRWGNYKLFDLDKTFDENVDSLKGPFPDEFNPNERIRQFRTKDGEVYGFTDGEKIYLDTRKMKPETPLHEYAHLWVEGLKAVNPEEWENVKKLFDKVEGLKEEVQKLYPELKGDDLYEEMITTFSGREGAKKLEQVVRELAAKDGKSVTDSAKAQGFVDRVREGLQRFWKGVADMLHIHFTTAEEVADKVLADWAKGVDPRVKKEKDVWDRLREIMEMTPEEQEELARRNAELEEKERKAKIQALFERLKEEFPKGDNEYTKALNESKTPEEAAAKFRQLAAEQRAIARDWQNRRYKKNDNKIDSHDIYGEEKTTTISKANERRRKAAVDHALEKAKDYDEFADDILRRCGLPKDTVPVIKERSDAYTRIVEISKEEKRMYDNKEELDVETENAHTREIIELAKNLSDEELNDLYEELREMGEDWEVVLYDEIEKRDEKKDIDRQSEIEQEQTERVAKCRPQADELKEAVESGDKGRIKKAKEALTKALLENGVGNIRLRSLLRAHKPSRKKDDKWSNFNKAATEAIKAAVKTLESELETKLTEAGLEGVHLKWDEDHQAWWLSADKESPYHDRIVRMDANERWIAEVSESNFLSRIPPITREYAKKLAEGIKSELEPSADPMKGLGKAAKKFKQDQALRNGQIPNGPEDDGKPWNEMTGEERLAVAEKNPLTEEEIRNNTSEENEDLIENAVDYVNGNHGVIQTAAYLKIYDDVRNRHETAPDNSGAEDGTQLAASDNGSGAELEHGTGGTGRGNDGPVDSGTGGNTAPGKPDGGKGSSSDTALPSGEQSHNEGKGDPSKLDPVAPRGAQPDGRGASGSNGSEPKQGGRGSGNGSAGTDAGRKPAAKQGTHFGNDSRANVKKKKEDAKNAFLAGLKEFNRKGRETASVSIAFMNKEQFEYFPKLIIAAGRYGMAVIEDGVYKLRDWVKEIRETVEEPMRNVGFSDKDIDDFINEMWKSKFKMDGEVHTIEEWAGIYGREQLRKALATPLEEKRKRQQEAESVEVKVGDRDNIAETLPFLLPEQQEDVMKAETQFFDPSHADDEHGGGRGMLFTNGTGTGKTYTGLGIVKRFIKQGKGRVLIVTPSQEKVTDWKNDATNLGITLTPLETSGGKSATKQKGEGAVITTFANFRANKALLEDVFDLVVYDESHKLMESKDAKETSTTQAHYRITNKDFDSAKERITMSHPLWKEQEQLMRERKKLLHGSETLDEARLNTNVSDAEIKRLEEIEARFEEVRNEQEKLMPEINKQARESVGKTKVVFLSATPFNTRENLDYVEGYLFSYGKPEVGENASAEEYARAKQQLRTSFYRQKFPHGSIINGNGRLASEVSDAVKLDEEERKFADTLMANGVMSGRTIDNGYDYSRDFPVVSVTHANEFNTSLRQMRDSQELRKFASEVFDDYNRMSVIYETMKVSAVRDRINGHIERGRRIVVFHRRRNDNQGLAEPPFAAALKMAEEYAAQLYAKNDSQSTAAATKLMQAVEKFKQDHRELLNWEQTLDYRMPREQLRSLFGDAHEYTPEEMAELNDRRSKFVDAAFNGRLAGITPYEAGKKYGEACFDVEDSNIVKQYKPHKMTDEEAEQLGVRKPSDKEYNAKLEAYKRVADEVKRGIDDAIKERIDKGIIKVELDENGKQVRHVGLFAGGDGKESKHNDVLSFNKDDSKMDIIVVQEASGKEGISLHDTTGAHQRVMINLALPQSPIAFIQAEGRIFRIGQKSNAIFEYPMLGIDNEVALFAGRFNGRAATTENLALGSMARGLRSSITRGILSKMGKVPLDGQGVGGREFDLREDQRKSGYDAAVEDYKNGDHSQDTCIDDMGTPEPIGYKMVEWANMREGESTLEPSAGNGNVSRYIPSDISSLSIEPDTNKSNRLMLQTGGVMRGSESAKGRKTQVMNGKFEDLSAVNKFDTVVMNSPNGAEGDMAIAHLEKAIQHVNDSGRVVAVIPDTDKMNKTVDELIAGNTALHLSGVVKMPPCAYTAGGVSQKTKIVVIDKLTREETRKDWKETQETDLSDVKDINTLFDKLKDVKMPERVIDPAAKSMRHANAAATALGKLKAFGRGSQIIVDDDQVYIRPVSSMTGKTRSGVEIGDKNYNPFHRYTFNYEKVKSLEQDVLLQYHICGEVLKMSDKDIADYIFPYAKTKQTTYVEDLKEYCKVVQKMMRGISGHTDGELERAYNGEDVNSKVQMTPGTKLSMEDLKNVFDTCNKKDEELGFLFDKVYAVAKDLGLGVSVYSDENTRTSSYYDGKGNKMRINAHFWNAIKIIDSKGDVIDMNDQKRAEVLTHELIHSVTAYAEYWNKVDPSRLSEPLREAANELEALYEHVMKNDSWRLPSYCRESASEFVAEASNPEVRNVLKKMGVWTRFVNAVKKFFSYGQRRDAIRSGIVDAEGFEQSSAYTELDKVIDKFLNNFDKESYDAYVAVCDRREDMAEGARPEDLGLDRLNHKVEDKEELDRLNKEKTFRMYSTLQEVDGQYASPMAGYEGKTANDMKLTNIVEPDTWFAADELDLNFTDEELKRMSELDASGKKGDVVLIPKTLRYHKDSESGKGTLQYFLKKTKKKGIWANYNPYNHTSTSMMNDQFTGAYGRSVDGNNLVTVEWDIPESEKNSGYQASYAHDPEGFRPWHSGVVNGLLPEDRQRSVMLSRHRRLRRVIPNEEVARNIADQLRGSGLAIPWNTLPKQLLEEVAKLGVPITTIPSGTVSSTYKKAFEQQMVELKEKYPQARFVDVKMTKDAYEEWGKDGGTHYRVATAADGASRSDSVSVVEDHVAKVSKKLGTKVNVVNSIDEVSDPRVKADIEAGKNVTGWYDEKTGQVHLYMPNVKDTYTAERTIWHETVGHKGMRGLLGEKFNDYLKGLWMDLDNPINKELRDYVRERMKKDSLSFYDAIEEYLADAAEKGKGDQGFWANIKNKVTDVLREIGYRIAPCTSDIKYMLWLAKNVQKHPNDPVWKMRAEAAKWKFEHEHYDDLDIEGTTLYENDGKDHSLEGMSSSELNEATDGKIHYRTSPSASTAIDRYTRALNKAGYMATEAYMDNMLSLKELMLAINPDAKNVEDIESYLNPYTLQNTMQGAMDAASKRFEREVMQPLDKAVANVLKAFGGKNQKERMRDFSLYLIKKHGLERNRVFYVRDTVNKLKGDDVTKADGIKMQNEWNAEKKRLGDALRNGQVTLKEYYDQMDEWIRKNIDPSYQAGEHDYSGMHGMYGLDDKAAYDDAAVIDEVMSAESAIENRVPGGVKDLWSKIHAATMFSVYSDYKNGIISKELFDHVSGMFDWYVPLRKFDEKTAEDVYGYINEDGHSDKFIGQTISKASGRYSLSDVNILWQIGALGNRAILNGGQNKIKQAFARFIRENYDKDPDHRLVTECDIWLEKAGTDNNGKPIWIETFPDIPEGSTPKKVSKIVKDFEDKMKAKAANGEAKRMKDKGSIPYRVTRQKDRSEHIVVVSIAGKEHCFVINANPRAAQALNGQLEQQNSNGWMARAGRGIIRWMAEACTSYNPEFVARNMVRDFEFASLNLAAKESARYVAKFEKYYMLVNPFKAGKTVGIKDFSGSTGIGLFKKYREGTSDMNDKTQKWFKEFVDNGGMTGFVQLKNMKDLGKEYESDIATDLSLLKKGGKSVKDFLIGNIEHLNEIAENMARFATYCASRESGRDPQRSAYDAKEVTVNFNRKGSGNRIDTFKTAEMGKGGKVARGIYGATASYLRQYSMFFNAGIQSTNMLLKNMKQHPIGTTAYIAAAPTALGILMPLINELIMNALGEDDKDRRGIKDPYAELPDYVRRNNLCIYKGKGEFITIPLAIETRAFYGFGDMIHGLSSGDIKMEDCPLQMAGLFGQLAPIADYLGNKDFADDPVGATFAALAPSFTVPTIEWYRNKDWKGSRIENRSEYMKDMPAWMRANTGTYSLLIDINKKANAMTNDQDKGNPEMLGYEWLDKLTNPSAIQHYFGGLGGGVSTFAGKAVNAAEKTLKGESLESKDIPFVRSFLYAPSETTSATRTKAKWYNYVDKMEKAKANIDRLKKRDPDPEKAMHNAEALYKYRESNTYKKVEIINRAQKEIKRIKKMRARTTDPHMVNGYDDRVNMIMAEAVEQMDKLN